MPGDLGVIGNGVYGSLVDRRGRVVWCSLEGFGADPIFNSLLNNDSDESGWFDVTIEDLVRTEQKYIANSAVLVTTLISKNSDVLQVKDFAPRFYQYDRMFHPFQLFRVITRIRGDPIATVRVRPSFEYNSAEGYQTRGAHHIRYCGPNGTLRLTTNAPIQLLMDESPFMVHDPVYLVFGQDESITTPLSQLCKEYEDRTIKYWKHWCMNLSLPVDYQEILVRSAITLQMMQSDEVGGILNSMTLGIPLGPDLPPTRDERVFQLLDTCLAIPVFRQLGLLAVTRKFLEFLKSTCFQYQHPKAVYDYIGRSSAPAKDLGSMAGYEGIGAVMAGGIPENPVPDIGMLGLLIVALSQGFFDARFRDICSSKLFERLENFGEQCILAFDDMLKGSFSLPRHRGVIAVPLWSHNFFEDDIQYFSLPSLHSSAGIITTGGYPAYSNGPIPTMISILCWASADRLSRVAEHCHWIEKSRYWGNAARRIRTEILTRAVRLSDNAMTSFWGGDRVGPSVLRIAELGFLAPSDPIFLATVSAFENDGGILTSLLSNVRPENRTSEWTALSTSSPFLTSTLMWYGEALRSCGRENEARQLFHAICAGSNECGLFSESIDVKTGKNWGNFPHTPSLLGFLRLGFRLSRNWSGV